MILRVCNECGKLIFEGYVINSGQEYYCSNGCVGKRYTSDEWNKMYSDESYYTTWKADQDDPVDYIEIVLEEILRIFSHEQVLKAIKKALCSISTTSISKRSFIILFGKKISE